MGLTEVSIDQMNNVIAKFDGFEPRFVEYPDKALNRWEIDKGSNWKPMEYHTSWDWLMTVISKIAKTISMMEAPKNDYELDSFEILRRPIYTAIKTAHNDVYQFILWYNQQINKPD